MDDSSKLYIPFSIPAVPQNSVAHERCTPGPSKRWIFVKANYISNHISTRLSCQGPGNEQAGQDYTDIPRVATTRHMSCTAVTRTRRSYCGERGRISQGKGFGKLKSKESAPHTHNMKSTTYIMNPSRYYSSGVISFPSLSFALEIVNAAMTEATASQRVSYPMKRPGQMRLPKPKAETSGSRTLGSISSSPSLLVRRKRSRLKASGSV